jgi:hypothetical protein
MVNLYNPENQLGTIHTFLTLNFLKSVIDRSELEKQTKWAYLEAFGAWSKEALYN